MPKTFSNSSAGERLTPLLSPLGYVIGAEFAVAAAVGSVWLVWKPLFIWSLVYETPIKGYVRLPLMAKCWYIRCFRNACCQRKRGIDLVSYYKSAAGCSGWPSYVTISGWRADIRRRIYRLPKSDSKTAVPLRHCKSRINPWKYFP